MMSLASVFIVKRGLTLVDNKRQAI